MVLYYCSAGKLTPPLKPAQCVTGLWAFPVLERWFWIFQLLHNIPSRGLGTPNQMLVCVQWYVWIVILSVLVQPEILSSPFRSRSSKFSYKPTKMFSVSRALWIFKLQIKDYGPVLSYRTRIPPAGLPTTFRLLSKTQSTACEILEFLGETKYPLNSQKNICQNNFFQVLSSRLLNMQTSHQILDRSVTLNSVTLLQDFLKSNSKRGKSNSTSLYYHREQRINRERGPMTIMVHPNASERMRILGPTFVPSYANKYMAGTHTWISWTHILSRRKGIYRRNDAFIHVKNLGWPLVEPWRSTNCKHQSPRTSQSWMHPGDFSLCSDF